MMRRWSLLVALGASLRPAHSGRPADCPCITWEMDDKCSNYNHFGWPTCSDYLFDPSPWAWQWIMNKNQTGGTCAKCSGSMKDFNCGYVFPCFAVRAPLLPCPCPCPEPAPLGRRPPTLFPSRCATDSRWHTASSASPVRDAFSNVALRSR